MNRQIELELRKFVAPEFIFGSGARSLTGQYAKNFGARKALVVTDPGVTAAGWTADVIKSLERENLDYAVFEGVTPNPKDYEVMAGAERYRSERCHAIVAVGGGSPMDCAKGIGIVCANQGNILDYEGVDQVERPLDPLICVPTTAGTSADVSQFAIITDKKKKVKIAIVSKTIVPDVALIDPETTTTMDGQLTAHTGLDAFVHAAEAFVSNAHSPVTDIHALEAVRIISKVLPEVIGYPGDMQLRGEMMLASLFAGLAFSNASLGAVHAMAHSLGGLLDLPHGVCNAILLEHVVEFNFHAASDRYRIIGDAMGLSVAGKKPEEARAELCGAIAALRRSVGVKETLGGLGVTKEVIGQLARNAMNDACLVTNPKAPAAGDVERIYEHAI